MCDKSRFGLRENFVRTIWTDLSNFSAGIWFANRKAFLTARRYIYRLDHKLFFLFSFSLPHAVERLRFSIALASLILLVVCALRV